MSHTAVQRAVVRMLYDPAFADAVYDDPQTPLPGLEGLSPAERDWLRRPDRRAYRTDPYRRSRSLSGLIEEHPATSCVVYTLAEGLRWMDLFFSSECFHRCIQERGSLALAYADYLASGAPADAETLKRIVALARLEGAMSRSRRSLGPPDVPPGSMALAPGLVPLQAVGGTLALFGEVMARLRAAGSDPLSAIVDGAPDVTNLPSVDSNITEPVLIEAGSGGMVDIGTATLSLVSLLECAISAQPRARLETKAGELGAERDEASSLLDDLLEEGLLVSG